MDKDQVMATMNCSVDDNLNIQGVNTTNTLSTGFTSGTSCWHYWQQEYYPYVIRESYPVYLTERAIDKGKQAFEIIKMLKDKRFIKLETVADFIDAMDALIKIL